MATAAERETASATAGSPTVDLLVPTRNRHDCLRRSLPSWLATGARIILCDQSPTPFAAAGVTPVGKTVGEHGVQFAVGDFRKLAPLLDARFFVGFVRRLLRG